MKSFFNICPSYLLGLHKKLNMEGVLVNEVNAMFDLLSSTNMYVYVWAGIFSAYMWILKSAGWLDGCHTFIRYLLKYSYSQERRPFQVHWSNLSIGILGQSLNNHLSPQKFLIKETSAFFWAHCILKNAFVWMRWMPSVENRVLGI